MAGRAPAIVSDASDAVRESRATTSQTGTSATVTTGTSTRLTPVDVATPRPPWRRRRSGKQCPITAAPPQASASCGPPASSPAPAATTPLARSPAKTTRPARVPLNR